MVQIYSEVSPGLFSEVSYPKFVSPASKLAQEVEMQHSSSCRALNSRSPPQEALSANKSCISAEGRSPIELTQA